VVNNTSRVDIKHLHSTQVMHLRVRLPQQSKLPPSPPNTHPHTHTHTHTQN